MSKRKQHLGLPHVDAMMQYDKIIKRKYYGRREKGPVEIEYGFERIHDLSSPLLFIKVGQNGSIYGYQNKYLKIASIQSERHERSTIVSSNPFDGSDSLGDAAEVIRECFAEAGIRTDRKVNYLGHSNGSLIAAFYAYKYADLFKELVLVNMPVKENYWPYIVHGLESFPGKVTFVYGEDDPSYMKAMLMLPVQFPNATIEVIENADHHFTEHMEAFLNLPEYFTLDEKDD